MNAEEETLREESRKAPDYQNIIGKIVFVEIDRPLGSRHPKHPDIIYPINYGYVKDIIGEDGEEQDVYLLGVDEPVKEFRGQVIAVFHRYNDVEDKWIVAPIGSDFSDEYILEKIHFLEQFFQGELYNTQFSSKIIPYTKGL